VAKCRSMFAFVLVFTWTATPALACLPNATMTRAEMACCKKMAGDCDMGVSQHSCCKTMGNSAAPVAKIERAAPQFQPQVLGILLDTTPLSATTLDRAFIHPFGLPPPAPPGPTSVLRI